MQQPGFVIKAHSGFFTVRTANGENITCTAAGRLTKNKHKEDALAIGDYVEYEDVPSAGFASGRITLVQPRKRSLSRKDPIASIKDRDIRQVIVANVDLVVFVFSCASPDFSSRMLDRYLVGAEAQRLPVLIVASKTDLVGLDAARTMFAIYEQLGYEVVYTTTPESQLAPTASTVLTLNHLHEKLHGKLSVLTGKSGVGKSTLLNALKPGLALEVGRISDVWKKGKHTTVVPELIELEAGTNSWLADTPGIRSLAIWDVEAEELDAYYRDIAPLVAHCQFNDCTHTHEKGCAVRAAVERGTLHQDRYDSYCKLREELGKQKKW